jgi:hypothetical protein
MMFTLENAPSVDIHLPFSFILISPGILSDSGTIVDHILVEKYANSFCDIRLIILHCGHIFSPGKKLKTLYLWMHLIIIPMVEQLSWVDKGWLYSYYRW